MKWTCFGEVRGGCGINHRSFHAAQICCAADQAAIRRAYPATFPTRAYSDRKPVPVDAAKAEAEIDWAGALLHHATDGGRVKLTAARVEAAATGLREANWKHRDAISEAEAIVLGENWDEEEA